MMTLVIAMADPVFTAQKNMLPSRMKDKAWHMAAIILQTLMNGLNWF